jgi:hypothetical protein
MAARGVRKKDYERLDDATIARVVLLLEQDAPVTKKAACEILHISYNTTRLNRIIAEHKDKIEYNRKRIAANKGREFSDLELKDLVIRFLSGDSVSGIADVMYRSVHVVKNEIKRLKLPERNKDSTYHNPDLMPDEMVSDVFENGEYVWSAKYNCVAEINDGEWDTVNQCNIYRIWIFGKYNQFGIQPAYELGKLEILRQFKLRDDEFVTTQTDFDLRIV